MWGICNEGARVIYRSSGKTVEPEDSERKNSGEGGQRIEYPVFRDLHKWGC